MKKITILFFALLCGFAFFSPGGKIETKKHAAPVIKPLQHLRSSKSTKLIYILPLGDVDGDYINNIKTSVKKFYGFDCAVLSRVDFTNDILAPSKTRYNADKILAKYDTKDYRIILTEKDIASENEERGVKEWGIFGLGYMPGTTCVVSTFRLKRNVTHDIVLKRLEKIGLHEIGHNLGLNHCSNNSQCMMSPANGSIKEVDQEKVWLCDKCRLLIQK